MTLPRSLAILLSLTALGCPEQVPPESAVPSRSGPPPSVGVVSVQVDPEAVARALAERGPSDREVAVLSVLDAARERATSCYTQALQRDPYLYGEVVMGLELGAGGGILEAVSVMDTVGDRDLVNCVERLVQAQRFPAPGAEGLVLRYPFLFTSDLTPPEVVRAMKAHHGLIDEGEPGTLDLETLDGSDPRGGTFDTW
jgi:hypothetical protein